MNHKATMEQLLTYGLLGDKLRHISEVENGLACECICPNCKNPLVAKNNPLNRKVGHFAHHSSKDCKGAIETALHLLAKSILLKTKKLNTPKYHYDYNPTNQNSIFKPCQNLTFDNILLEKPVEINGDKIIPDAIGELNGKQVYIEFANTHFIDTHKKNKLKNSGVSCIEINLKGQLLDEVNLTTFINSDTPLKYWIANPKFDKEYSEFKQQQKRKKEQKRKEKDQKRREKEEQEKAENETKVFKYKNSVQFKIYNANKWGKVSNCPIKTEKMEEFKFTAFYRHTVLKGIINGHFWKGEIYGYKSNGKFIFVKGEKIFIYPPDNIQTNDTEKKENDFFYAGLNKIAPIITNPSWGDCKNCKHLVDNYYIADKYYYVCKHEKDTILKSV